MLHENLLMHVVIVYLFGNWGRNPMSCVKKKVLESGAQMICLKEEALKPDLCALCM